MCGRFHAARDDPPSTGRSAGELLPAGRAVVMPRGVRGGIDRSSRALVTVAAVTATGKLLCESCRRPIGGSSAVAATEVLTERDSSGRVVAARDGYNVVFHDSCWRDLQTGRAYSSRSYRRPRPSGGAGPG
jgi:hypothetical protein